MLILHVSDIHFKHPLCHGEEDPELYFRNELVAHAGEQIGDLGDVDAILITGDIAFRGIASEYDAATKWLETLAKAVGCSKRRTYVIPGNHDVNRSIFLSNGGARNAVLAIANADDNSARECEMKQQLNLDDSARNLFASIADYNIFAAKYDCQSYPGRLRWRQTLQIDSRTVLNLHGLNSTLISGINGDDVKGTLFMGAMQMNIARASGTVNLVMVHHPPEWMSDQDELEMRLLGAPNIVLFGHKHIQAIRRDVNGLMMFSAGSVNPDPREKGWEPAYNLIELTSIPDNGRRVVEVSVYQFRWQSNPNGFVAKIDIATNSPVFRHTIQINGENNQLGDEPLSAEEGGAVMTEEEKISAEPSSLANPNIRDLIYRFWVLESRRRRQVLEELGVKIDFDATTPEIMTYRSALVSLAEESRLAELDAAIAKKEPPIL